MGRRASRSVRVIKSVLHNTLGTFVSRYSDYCGYWLLGQIPMEPASWTADLLEPALVGPGLFNVARRLAARRFAEQLGKTEVARERVMEAELMWRRGNEAVRGWHGNGWGRGYHVALTATARMDDGRSFNCSVTVFVAPHDPSRESRRSLGDWGAQ